MTTTGYRPARFGRPMRAACLALALGLSGLLAGCETGGEAPVAQAAPPPPTYVGESYLHGSVGSMVRLRNSQPLLVSGYGIVVNLDGTGSAEVPQYLRRWLMNQMQLKGLGSARLNTRQMTPDSVLASDATAVVAVRGIIPPGATRGTRFDVLVEALPNTQTTSLEGGQLWTVDLAIDGLNTSMQFSQPLALGRGAMFLNPLTKNDPSISQEQRLRLPRQGVVLAGGLVTESRRIELVLNQRGWVRSRTIADRINERFPIMPGDRTTVAAAVSDAVVRVEVPRSWIGREGDLLKLVSHVFVEREAGFVQNKTRQLAGILATDAKQAPRVVAAWRALGKTALPVLREYYNHADLNVRLAALEAGVKLEDPTPTQSLLELVRHADVNVRAAAARSLIELPRSLKVANAIRTLLDDESIDATGRPIRIVTYEAMADRKDPMIQRVPIGDANNIKFLIDLLPADKPMVYASQEGLPRLVIFGRNTGFKAPINAALWDGRLRLRSGGVGETMSVFYQRPNGSSKTFQMAPTVANLALLLGQPASLSNPHESPNLSYSHVVSALVGLHLSRHLAADWKVQPNALADAIERYLRKPADTVRPEIGAKPSGYQALATQRNDAVAQGDTTNARPSVGTPRRVGDVPDALPAPTPRPTAQVDPSDLPPAQETYLIPAPSDAPSAPAGRTPSSNREGNGDDPTGPQARSTP